MAFNHTNGTGSVQQLSLYIMFSTGLLIAHTFAGPVGLALGAVALPFGFWAYGVFAQQSRRAGTTQEDLIAALEQAMNDYRAGRSNAAFFLIECQSMKTATALDALQSALRPADVCGVLPDGRIGVCAVSIRRFDVESGLHIAERLRDTLRGVSTPDAVLNIGFCLASRTPKDSADGMVDGATRALIEAKSRASSGICAYSKLLGGTTARGDLVIDVERAFENNEIRPLFQPQVDVETGALIGAEALARWYHPQHGMIPPLEFLSAIKSAGCWATLTDEMLHQSLQQLARWDQAGLNVGQVSVNFSETDLSHPQIVDRVKWALDAASLPPFRLVVEVLESVAAENDPAILANVQALADLGCQIDLDDFGTGHAAISTLRQFPAHRIKVDRSFIIKIDQDPEQQDMLATILMMADRLGVATLVEGVETRDEIQTVKSLGCALMQGFGLGRPMDGDGFTNWAQSHPADKIKLSTVKVA